LTHNFSDLGFVVTIGGWYFLIAFFHFTPIMFAVLMLYLLKDHVPPEVHFDYCLVQLLYVLIVFFTGVMTDTHNWITLGTAQISNYFWSLLAITFDIFFMAIFWELLSKIKSLPLLLKVFLVTVMVLSFDTLIFTTGFFGGSDIYWSILKGNLVTRLILSIFASTFITVSLKSDGFTEENREKPTEVWEVLNFRSDLETKIKTLEDSINSEKALRDKISQSEEAFKLAITGAGAGIWDWIPTNEIFWAQVLYPTWIFTK
jgi:hypothetical protein